MAELVCTVTKALSKADEILTLILPKMHIHSMSEILQGMWREHIFKNPSQQDGSSRPEHVDLMQTAWCVTYHKANPVKLHLTVSGTYMDIQFLLKQNIFASGCCNLDLGCTVYVISALSIKTSRIT